MRRRIVEEAREHLVDATAEGLKRGLSVDAAEREALVRFGPPETIAARFAKERHPMVNRLLVVLTRIARLIRSKPLACDDYGVAVHYHDVGPAPYHFALRLKRQHRNRFKKMSADEQQRFIAEKRERGEDVSAFETDARERLIQFLREFGRRMFGSRGTLESLTLLEDTTDSSKRGGRYLAAFSSGTTMIWTVALDADGTVSFDGTGAAA
jgi:hypothetical protein